VDIYGALSEYIGACITGDAVTLLDINNSVPKAQYENEIAGKFNYELTDTFMGFQLRQHAVVQDEARPRREIPAHPARTLEPEGSAPDFTRGTLEGDIARAPSPSTPAV
jgi:L-fucose isomerase-like protein